jgi:hypothetical protein
MSVNSPFINHKSIYLRTVSDQTLALAALSLASKVSEAPRRLRELIIPGYALIQGHKGTHPKLKIPSMEYDGLRASLVRVELLLLRVLGFDLRVSSPFDFLERYISRALEDYDSVAEEYEQSGKETMEEYGVGGLMDTSFARECGMKALQALVLHI